MVTSLCPPPLPILNFPTFAPSENYSERNYNGQSPTINILGILIYCHRVLHYMQSTQLQCMVHFSSASHCVCVFQVQTIVTTGLRQEEIAVMGGPDEFAEFYRRLKHLKDHHRKWGEGDREGERVGRREGGREVKCVCSLQLLHERRRRGGGRGGGGEGGRGGGGEGGEGGRGVETTRESVFSAAITWGGGGGVECEKERICSL